MVMVVTSGPVSEALTACTCESEFTRQGQLQVLVAAQAQMLAEGTDAAFTGLHALRQFRD